MLGFLLNASWFQVVALPLCLAFIAMISLYVPTERKLFECFTRRRFRWGRRPGWNGRTRYNWRARRERRDGIKKPGTVANFMLLLYYLGIVAFCSIGCGWIAKVLYTSTKLLLVWASVAFYRWSCFALTRTEIHQLLAQNQKKQQGPWNLAHKSLETSSSHNVCHPTSHPVSVGKQRCIAQRPFPGYLTSFQMWWRLMPTY